MHSRQPYLAMATLPYTHLCLKHAPPRLSHVAVRLFAAALP